MKTLNNLIANFKKWKKDRRRASLLWKKANNKYLTCGELAELCWDENGVLCKHYLRFVNGNAIA